ncbi:hypothetical protein [Methanosarcina horonobensis]|uniref:hypothetical protein n=1 Tax=Methanosarcina horonobensis TaxID=418008 RepID=UPI000A3FF15C|nr:hypothetical protein [Methanosarcina horonobensis]
MGCQMQGGALYYPIWLAYAAGVLEEEGIRSGLRTRLLGDGMSKLYQKMPGNSSLKLSFRNAISRA